MKRLGWFLTVTFAMALITTFIFPANGSAALVGDIGPPDAQLVSADLIALDGTTQIITSDAKLIGPMAVTMPEVMDAGVWSSSLAQAGNELDKSLMGSTLNVFWEYSGTITIAGGAPAATLTHPATDMLMTSGPAARSSGVSDHLTIYAHWKLDVLDGRWRNSFATTETMISGFFNGTNRQIGDHLLL